MALPQKLSSASSDKGGMQVRAVIPTMILAAIAAGAGGPALAKSSSHHLPSSAELIDKFDAKLAKLLGECSCTIDPKSAAADSKPIGKINVLDWRGEELPIAVVNDEYALRLFQEMTMQKKIPFGFPEDGCYARAHEMAWQLTRKGIVTGKVFATGVFRLANDKAAKGSVVWNFHVAPFVVVDTGKNKQIWIIDPSLFYEPVTLRGWLEALTAHPKAKLNDVYLASRYTYHPSRREQQLTDFDPADLRKAHRLMKRYRVREERRTRKTSPDL